MSYSSARTAIAAHIGSTLDSSLTLRAENEKRANPTTGVWARWSIRPANSRTVDVSAHDEETVGLLWFQIFIPEGGGTVQAHTMADAIAGAFNEKRLQTGGGGVLYFDRVVLELSGTKTDGWTQHNARIRYTERAPAHNAA